ncbi:MAG: cytochrome c oxidase assembly factor Coa1 family protein [Chthoniobacterales bacterium]
MEPSPPQPPPIPPIPDAPVRRGWWTRNWKWFVPTGCLTIVALMFAFALAILFTVFGLIKSTEPYKTAVARAKANVRVTEALGTPIDEGWYVFGNANVSGGSGTADLSIPISGPKAKGTIYAVASKSAGQWEFSKLVVKVESTAETIDLSEAHESPEQQ